MKRTLSVALGAVVTVVALAAVETMVSAQGGAPAPAVRMLVTTTQVRPGMANDYRAIVQNEVVPANKKAGVPWRWVFQSGPLGGAAGTFVTVTPITGYAQFDGPNAAQRALGTEGAAKLNAKTQAMVASTYFVVQTLQQPLSLQSYSSTAPALAVVQEIDLIAGKGPEFAALITQSYLPALKKAGVTDYLVFTQNFGGAGNHRTIVQFLSKYADLDQPNPIVRALGQEGAQKLGQQRAVLTTKTETFVYRLVPEMSYGVPARPKT
jgi:hypothetical protein